MGVGGQRHAPAALPPTKTRYPLYWRLGGLQGRSGLARKISPPPGFDTRSVQPVASRYTDCTIIFFFFFFLFSSRTLHEFWLAQLFLSNSSSPASFVSNYSLPSSSSHSSHRLPILLLAFPSVLLHTVSICIWPWSLFRRSFFLHAPTSPVVCILYILLYFRY